MHRRARSAFRSESKSFWLLLSRYSRVPGQETGGRCDIVSWQPRWPHSPTGTLPCTPLPTTPEEITRHVTPAVAAPPGQSRGPDSRSPRSLGTWSSTRHQCSLQPAWPPRHAPRWVSNLQRRQTKPWARRVLDPGHFQRYLQELGGTGTGASSPSHPTPAALTALVWMTLPPACLLPTVPALTHSPCSHQSDPRSPARSCPVLSSLHATSHPGLGHHGLLSLLTSKPLLPQGLCAAVRSAGHSATHTGRGASLTRTVAQRSLLHGPRRNSSPPDVPPQSTQRVSLTA